MNFGVLLEFNTLLTAFLLLMMSVSLGLYKSNPRLVFLIYTVFFTFVVLLWEPTDISKEKLLLIMLIFGLYGIVTESFIVSKTSVLEYKFPDSKLGLNSPLYLVYIYASWVLVIQVIFKLVK